MEDPGYRFAQNVFCLNGCELIPVPVDDEGMNVAEGIKRCRNAEAALVTPSHQYPLGSTMSATRRLQLLDWAHRSGSWIIEDDYDSEYRYETLPRSRFWLACGVHRDVQQSVIPPVAHWLYCDPFQSD